MIRSASLFFWGGVFAGTQQSRLVKLAGSGGNFTWVYAGPGEYLSSIIKVSGSLTAQPSVSRLCLGPAHAPLTESDRNSDLFAAGSCRLVLPWVKRQYLLTALPRYSALSLTN